METMELLPRSTEDANIDGPDCLECGSPTELYIAPSQFAGLWQCLNPDCAASDEHEHTWDYTSRTVEDFEGNESEESIRECEVCHDTEVL